MRSWLAPEGRFLMHIFTHRSGFYLFDRANREDWIAQHFFTGGLMPSHHLVRQGRQTHTLSRPSLVDHLVGTR